MERTEIIKLLKEEGYPEFMLEKTADKIVAFAPVLAVAFEEFSSVGTSPQITVEGYSFEKLVDEFNMNPIGAFITLDWLIREPENAKNALIKGLK